MNKHNFKLVLDTIKANPESWDQTQWHCGTTHCFAGHAQILAGYTCTQSLAGDRQAVIKVVKDAEKFLGVTEKEGYWLFMSRRKMEDFEKFLATYDDYQYVIGTSGIVESVNKHGYGRDGYNLDNKFDPSYVL